MRGPRRACDWLGRPTRRPLACRGVKVCEWRGSGRSCASTPLTATCFFTASLVASASTVASFRPAPSERYHCTCCGVGARAVIDRASRRCSQVRVWRRRKRSRVNFYGWRVEFPYGSQRCIARNASCEKWSEVRGPVVQMREGLAAPAPSVAHAQPAKTTFFSSHS